METRWPIKRTSVHLHKDLGLGFVAANFRTNKQADTQANARTDNKSTNRPT
jgi:hypothetical protein